jgi:hypothetical protein
MSKSRSYHARLLSPYRGAQANIFWTAQLRATAIDPKLPMAVCRIQARYAALLSINNCLVRRLQDASGIGEVKPFLSNSRMPVTLARLEVNRH